MGINEALDRLRDFAPDGKKYCPGASGLAFAAFMELKEYQNAEHAYWRRVKENAEFPYEVEIADIMLSTPASQTE